MSFCTVYPSLTFQVLTVTQKAFLIFKTLAMSWDVYRGDGLTVWAKSNVCDNTRTQKTHKILMPTGISWVVQKYDE